MDFTTPSLGIDDCPECGASTGGAETLDDASIAVRCEPGGAHVECLECGHMGPDKGVVADSITGWNRLS